MRTRLLLGPVMLLALAATLWLDQWLGGLAAPAALAPVLGRGGSLPPGLALLLLGLVLMPVAVWELAAILGHAGLNAPRSVLTAAGAIGMIVVYAAHRTADAPTAAAMVASGGVVVLVVALGHHSRDRVPKGATGAAASALFAFVYLGVMFGFVPAMRWTHSAWVVLAVLVCIKSCDIGAYFTGKSIGRHKLIPWLSPGKTREGLAGGVALAAGVGALGAVLLVRHGDLSPRVEVWHGALAGAVFALTGQAGDLLASLLKRDAGLKDSSTVVPGFGGILDVVDSVLLVAPVAYWLLRLAEPASEVLPVGPRG